MAVGVADGRREIAAPKRLGFGGLQPGDASSMSRRDSIRSISVRMPDSSKFHDDNLIVDFDRLQLLLVLFKETLTQPSLIREAQQLPLSCYGLYPMASPELQPAKAPG